MRRIQFVCDVVYGLWLGGFTWGWWRDQSRMPAEGDPLEEEELVSILHAQPDGTWHVIGEVPSGSPRVPQELATPGRAIKYGDGTICGK